MIQNQEKSPNGLSSGGYSPSPSPKSSGKANPFIDEITKALGDHVEKLNSPLKETDLVRGDNSSTPNVPIQPGMNRGIRIDPRSQFQEKLEEARAARVERVKQSMKPLPSILVIEIDADDTDLDDLLKPSEHVVSNSDNKSVQQEKEDTIIQKARSEALRIALQKSVAEEMIRLMNQLLDILQKDPYWNDELINDTSCLVEQQFSDKYREHVSFFGKIFENLFHSRENLSNLRLKDAMIKENSDALINAKKALKDKDVLYEKHLKNANDALEELSKDKDALMKKLAEIQAQIHEIDERILKLKTPFEKIQVKKLEVKKQLSEIEKSKMQNEDDLKKLQEEEDQETELFKHFEEDKV
ncbi:hypothetical protein PIB30_009212 [Stylosanthes scabra]|uniref:Uncharacterized protein n=1 Tax=Stylosanthes scabra TaxID=79078 RepID=A0ABU6Z279_9FABA|nr:hypothetical protein [Stylosanthes scabra]